KFKGGNAIFTQPATPIKCGGAPQKAMYLAADYFKKQGILDKTNVVFATPGTVIFAVKTIADTLMKVINRYGIDLRLYHTPVKIDSENKLVYFKDNTPNEANKPSSPIIGSSVTDGDLIKVPFDFLHIAPPQVAPPFIRESKLSNEDGWLDVDIHSLQHKKYPNIFGLGDATGVTTAKTGAAIRKQVPVVVVNILALIKGTDSDNKSLMGYYYC